MTFTSLIFPLFFLLVTAVYYICPPRLRWAPLLLASCYFYMAFVPKYILILFALILIDFVFAQQIEKTADRRRKKKFFIGSIIASAGMLFVFKYFNFFNENIALLAHVLHWNYSIGSLKLILPLGLSFHIFQSLSYVIEVYRGKQTAERHLGRYALYVLFFPQLIAGPIERPQQLLPQLRKTVSFDLTNIFYGLRLMAWGFFKKLVIADRLAVSVDYVYGNISGVPSLSILLVMIFFAFQLYADFSGYTDIARGSARVLGIDLMRNFDRPYFSGSIAEFWRRWHISLSSWFRDYFFFPLAKVGGSRLWLYGCVLFTFLVTGLWHGAGWTFVIMGAIHGSAIVIGMASKAWRGVIVKHIGLVRIPRLHRTLQIIFTFALVSFSWIFFRSPNLEVAFAFIGRLFSGWDMSTSALIEGYYRDPYLTLGLSQSELVLSFGGILFLLGIEYLEGKIRLIALLDRQPLFVRSFLYSGMLMAIFVFGIFVSKQFIYFQF